MCYSQLKFQPIEILQYCFNDPTTSNLSILIFDWIGQTDPTSFTTLKT